jgi:hypothetical protein
MTERRFAPGENIRSPFWPALAAKKVLVYGVVYLVNISDAAVYVIVLDPLPDDDSFTVLYGYRPRIATHNSSRS